MERYYPNDMSSSFVSGYFPSPPPYPTSLHVADLDSRVDEALLTQHFTSLGHRVMSVKIVRDKLTHQSAGYGYVNFATEAEALDALDKVNYTKLLGKPMRISRARPTVPPPYPGAPSPARRVRNPYANIYIKNLDPSVDAQALYQHCKRFGQITSIRVMENPDGTSKGYGFVAFEYEQEAQRAVAELNNTEFRGQKIYVTFAYPQMPSAAPSYGVPFPGATFPPSVVSRSAPRPGEPYYVATSSPSPPSMSSGDGGIASSSASSLPASTPGSNTSARGPVPPSSLPPSAWRGPPPMSSHANRHPAYSAYTPPTYPPAPGSPSAYNSTTTPWDGYADPYAAYAASYTGYNAADSAYAHYMYNSTYPYPYGYAYSGYETASNASSTGSSTSSATSSSTTATDSSSISTSASASTSTSTSTATSTSAPTVTSSSSSSSSSATSTESTTNRPAADTTTTSDTATTTVLSDTTATTTPKSENTSTPVTVADTMTLPPATVVTSATPTASSSVSQNAATDDTSPSSRSSPERVISPSSSLLSASVSSTITSTEPSASSSQSVLPQ